jgi:RHS repeat-associated protein
LSLFVQTVYNAPTPAGQAVDTIDNAGCVTRTLYDAAGRTVMTIQNYLSGGINGAISATDSDAQVATELQAGDTAEDVTTKYDYDSAGRLATMIAYDPLGTGNGIVQEATRYLYQSSVDASLPTAVVAPDSTDSLTHNTTTGDWSITSGTDHTSTTYDWLGRATSSTDQRGVTHTYTYDSAGRLAADTVTIFGNLPTAAQTVDEIATGYDDVSRVQTVTSYGPSANGQIVVNQVKEAYDGWGDLSREWQSPTGVVTGSTASVQYDYADGSQGGVAAYLRLTDVIYPNGRDVEYGYGTTGSTDDVLGQVATIAGSDGTYAAYTYLGVGTIVTEDYQQPQVKLDYTNGSGQITGLDRFGRVADQVWSDYGNSTTADEFKYGYDMSGNVAWKENVVSGSQLSPVHLDELYGYNALSELTDVNRGELNTTHDGIETGTLDYSQSWTLDGLGNWSSFDDNGATQTRQVDQSNEITSITGGPQTPAYDLAGNMTTMPQPGDATNALTCVYDAWDRLVQVSSGGTVVAQYQYDGADRLVSETASGTTTYSFYAGQSVIETRVGGTAASNVKYQYVWSLRGDQIPILRDTYSSGQLQSASRIYYTTDANSNVTAIIGLSGGTWVVIERYVYDAYGTVSVYSPAWTYVGGYSSSTVGNTLFFAGLSVDLATGLQHADFRWYNSAIATWTAQDPIGFAAGDANLSRFVGDNPVNYNDPSGSEAQDANPCGSIGASEVAPDGYDYRTDPSSWQNQAKAASDVKWAFDPSNAMNPEAQNIRNRLYDANGGQMVSPFFPMSRYDIQMALHSFELVPAVGAIPAAENTAIYASNGEMRDTAASLLTLGAHVLPIVSGPNVPWEASASSSLPATNVTGISAEQAAQLRQMLLDIPGVEDVRVFGSRTTGMSRASSDLDVLLIGDVDRRCPGAINAMRSARIYARKIGIGPGKGRQYLDPQIFPSMNDARNPGIWTPFPDPNRPRVPIFKKLQ